ncbi:coatomer WD associated region-domain-containing protein [Coprinopsis sp. MPI-PUGE-AT-0042]|nr:coatomer WD associated region-domain-containing protein [Coprinopsis sp. MPI-PUGE-AT-0042]
MKGAGSFAGNGFVIFWDWETGEIVRRIDVDAKGVYWSGTGTLVAAATDDSYYILRFDRDAYTAQLEPGTTITDEGVEEAFDVVAEIPDGTCKSTTTPSPLSVVEYQTAMLRGDMEAAEEILESVPKSEVTKVARFLEGRDHKFDLALSLDDLDTAANIVREVPATEAAVNVWRFDLARESFEAAGDLGSLLPLLLAQGDRDGLSKLAATAQEKGQNNLAFATLLQIGDTKGCVDLLLNTQRKQ